MADWPPVIVLIITYKRLLLALETIRSVKAMVDYPNIGFHVADDGSGGDYVNRLCQEIGGTYNITVTDAQRGGVGKNMNLGIHACLDQADLWLHLEDDWVLRQPLDLRSCVQLLVENQGVGMVRLGRLTAGLQGQVISGAGKLWWLLRRAADTYTFSGNASLRHRKFQAAYGDYREGLTPGQTELWYCGNFNGREGPGIIHPAWLGDGQMFHHIGDHQSYKWWMETGGLSAEDAAKRFAEMDAVKA